MDMLLSYHITPHKVTPASTMSTAHCQSTDYRESGAVRGAEAKKKKHQTNKTKTKKNLTCLILLYLIMSSLCPK